MKGSFGGSCKVSMFFSFDMACIIKCRKFIKKFFYIIKIIHNIIPVLIFFDLRMCRCDHLESAVNKSQRIPEFM